jgi:hypothetical protein
MDPVLPSGIEEYLADTQYKVETEGGSGNWMHFPSIKRVTTAYILDLENRKVSKCLSALYYIFHVRSKLLLGYKKRGFAQGVSVEVPITFRLDEPTEWLDV